MTIFRTIAAIICGLLSVCIVVAEIAQRVALMF